MCSSLMDACGEPAADLGVGIGKFVRSIFLILSRSRKKPPFQCSSSSTISTGICRLGFLVRASTRSRRTPLPFFSGKAFASSRNAGLQRMGTTNRPLHILRKIERHARSRTHFFFLHCLLWVERAPRRQIGGSHSS